MSRAARISKEVRTAIWDEALKDRSISRLAVAAKLKSIIEGMGERSPKTDTLLKEISKARNQQIPDSEDQPWSFGTLKEHPLAPDALPHVHRVWRYSLANGYLMTIRHARWVAQLHCLESNTITLWELALVYASREQTCASLRQPFDTLELDTSMMQGVWESETAKYVGRPYVGRGSSNHFNVLDEDTLREIVSEAEEPLFDKSFAEDAMLMPFGTLGLAEEATIVYSLWLKHIQKGPHWQQLKDKKKVTIITELRYWIQQQANALANVLGSEVRMFKDFRAIVEGRPIELLKIVGYEEE
ncbi:MAG: hypothetical protein HQ553_03585 [Chloroflexi bacterium]|nr:hypothetical protein [Chloroflexota bacterium]